MERKPFSISIAKPGQGQVNEDAAIAKENLIAVSDGAGGGGLYADLWSSYLLENLPDKPMNNFDQFDSWLDGIWEIFYNKCEDKAKQEGGMVLNKFYEEGSFATLAVAWIDGNICKWMSFGDSVVFHYNRKTCLLEHSFGKLIDFNKPPHLINCKDSINEEGLKLGEFHVDSDSVVFCATDALAHYIIMCYEISKCNLYGEELTEAINAGTKNSICINSATARPVDFRNRVVNKLCKCSPHNNKFQNYVKSLLDKKYIVLDDYSYALFQVN